MGAPKALSRLMAKTKASNTRYAKLPDHKKRVVIARDVIKAIKLNQITPTNGIYLGIDLALESAVNSNPNGSFQETIPTLPTCQVCAKGAIFLCAVQRQNQVSNAAARFLSWHDYGLSAALDGLFSKEQLQLIETAFEGAYMGWGDGEECMLKIMRNIVKNDGTFVFDPVIEAEIAAGRLS